MSWFKKFRHRFGWLTKAEREAEAVDLIKRLEAEIEKEERRQIRAAYLASDVQTKRKTALDRISARLDRYVDNHKGKDWPRIKRVAELHDRIYNLILDTDEQRRSEFEMARYKASDTATTLPLQVGDKLRQGKDIIEITYDKAEKLYGYKLESEKKPRVQTRDIEILAKMLYFDFPACDRVNM